MGNAIDVLQTFESMINQQQEEEGLNSGPVVGPAVDPARQQAMIAERERMWQEAEAERQRLLKLKAAAIADLCSAPGNPFCGGQSHNPFDATDDNPFSSAQ